MTTPARALLPDFEYRRMDVGDVNLNYAIGGSGPPLLLLHGYPQNHLMWRHVAPGLARDHTVVLADLRGYGDSGKPEPDAAGLVYAKRSMAADQVGLMRELGFTRFSLVGHSMSGVAIQHVLHQAPDRVRRLVGVAPVPATVIASVTS